MLDTITVNRKKRFCQEILFQIQTQVGFADIGSGGELKAPWNIFPESKLHKFDFDPEVIREVGKLPLCISNKMEESIFYIAKDPRSSSLHLPSDRFVERFSQNGLLLDKEVMVMCTTLDQLFDGRFSEVDFLDVNVEGHDFQVLQGSGRLFAEGFIEGLKVEFELTKVWDGQGWFSDIDALQRGRGYDLAFIDIEYSRPSNVKNIAHMGEPLWGKAIYVPGMEYWMRISEMADKEAFKDGLFKSIALYVALDLPGRAFDLLKLATEERVIPQSMKGQLVKQVFSVFQYAKLDAFGSRLRRIIPLLSRLFR